MKAPASDPMCYHTPSPSTHPPYGPRFLIVISDILPCANLCNIEEKGRLLGNVGLLSEFARLLTMICDDKDDRGDDKVIG